MDACRTRLRLALEVWQRARQIQELDACIAEKLDVILVSIVGINRGNMANTLDD